MAYTGWDIGGERSAARKERREVRRDQGRFGQVSRRALRQDVKDMQEGNLGLGQGEKRHLVQEATTAAGTQMGKQQELAARQALGGVQGTGLSPEEIAETSAATAAQASAGADLASKELAENRRKEIIARVNRQQDINRAMTQHYLDWGLELALAGSGLAKSRGASTGGGGGGEGAAAGKMAEIALSMFGG